MPLAVHQRVQVHKPGSADHLKCGSIVQLTATGALVVLEDGNDAQSGGELPPAAPKAFLTAELPER